LLVYFLCVFAGTWALAGLMMFAPGPVAALLGPPGVANPLFFAAVYVPSVTGLILTAVFEGRDGLRRILGRLNPLAFSPVWYPIVIVGMPLAVAAGALMTGGRPGFMGLAPALSTLGLSLVLDPGPVGEELGWRGFALPRLLERWSPPIASLILGAIWGVWHLPAFFITALPQSQMSIPVFVLGTVILATLMTGAHLRTGGSILIAILIHLMANHAGEIVRVSSLGSATSGYAIAALAIVLLWRRFRTPPTAA
jgi:membrane protease YdiL (CAAX protease family)